MSTVDQLIATIKNSGGTAKANRYRVLFIDGDGDKLNIMCDSVTWPGRQIVTTEYSTSMKATKKPYGFLNEDVSISFILSNDWYTWNYLKEWQALTINDIDSDNGTYSVNLKSDYARQVVVEHLDEQDRVRKTLKLYAAYPTTLNAIELGNSNENTIIRCTALLSYDNWESADTDNTNNLTSSVRGVNTFGSIGNLFNF
jgi:hypothetical protein